MGDLWDYGFIKNPIGNGHLRVDGLNIMVQTTSLSILESASEGRITPLNVWHWVVLLRRYQCGPTRECFINYSGPEATPVFTAFPGLSSEAIFKMYESRDSISDEEILVKLIYEGRFWLWMRPDR